MSGILTAFIGRVAGVVTDAYFNLVTLLLPGNGTNGAQNNTFLDSSANNFTITRNGNTTQGTFSPFSQTGWSNYFDGSGDYLTGNAVLVTTTTANTFSCEGWFYPTSFANLIWLVGDMSATTGTNNIAVDVSTGGAIELYWFDGVAKRCTSTTVMNLNQWNYFAIVVNAGAISIYVNSTTAGQSGTTTLTNRSGASQNFTIGQFNNSTTPNGYISNLRWSTSARTISAIPTAPYTSDANTRLLTCQSNRFIDNSSNAFTLTPNGNVSVQAFSPFLPTTAYDAATVGGSGYFDGTGDNLVIGDNANLDLATGDFTVECWFYVTSSAAARPLIRRFDGDAGSRNDLQYGITYITSGNLVLSPYQSTTNLDITFTSVPLNQWNHCALVRTGNTVYGFLNGVRNATSQSVTTLNTGTWSTYVGTYTEGGVASAYLGYMSSVRVTKGGALYTGSTYTVPTAPFTTSVSAGTAQLLLNFTNAGITDATAKNDLETVGNAQISTTQSKFGGSSISFDGTGDWLLMPHTADQMFGTGAFTVEFWLYLGATGAARGLVAKGTSTTGWLVSLDSSNKVVFTYTTSTITSTGAISGTTWTHIAVVREGTGSNQTKIYINGTNDGTGTVSTDFNQTSVMYVGANRTGGDALNGYIDDLRITKGYARYTGNFTAPTAAFPLQ